MIRIIRTRALRALRAGAAAARIYEAEADRWNRLYLEESERADALLAERDAALAELAELRLAAGAARVVPAAPIDHTDQDARHSAAEAVEVVLAADRAARTRK